MGISGNAKINALPLLALIRGQQAKQRAAGSNPACSRWRGFVVFPVPTSPRAKVVPLRVRERSHAGLARSSEAGVQLRQDISAEAA